MFSMLLDTLKEKTTIVVCRSIIQNNSEETMQKEQAKRQNIKMSEIHENPQELSEKDKETSKQEPIRNFKGNIDPQNPQTWGKVSRNDLCPCGSGKKFKHCHGKFE